MDCLSEQQKMKMRRNCVKHYECFLSSDECERSGRRLEHQNGCWDLFLFPTEL